MASEPFLAAGEGGMDARKLLMKTEPVSFYQALGLTFSHEKRHPGRRATAETAAGV
jgi:hypothetical protein